MCSSRESDGLSSEIESDEEFNTLYTCYICNVSKMDLVDFLNHSKIHSKEEKTLALEQLKTSKEIEEFAARKSAAEKGFKVQMIAGSSVTLYLCSTCGQGNLLLKDLEQHSRLHPRLPESYYCYLCQQQFEDKCGLDVHLGTHLDNNDLICQFCNKRFTIIQDLEMHETSHLQEEFGCINCSQSFKTKSSVLFHFRKCHFVDSSCVICKLKLTNNISINEHFMTHTFVNAIKRIVKYFTCRICPKKYESKLSLQRHTLFVHYEREQYICEYCGFTAHHEAPLREHVVLEHQNVKDKNKRKTHCVKNVASKKSYIGHLESNSTEKQCDKPFQNKDLALNEINSGKFAKPILNSFPFQCEICKAHFRLEFELDDHSSVHNIIYHCHLCFKEFVTDKNLQEHIAECKMESGENSEVPTSKCLRFGL